MKETSIFLILLLTLTLCVKSAAAQSAALPKSETVPPRPVNLDFEQGTSGQVPVGWQFSPLERGYSAETTDKVPRTGTKTAIIRSEPDAKIDAASFGSLLQTIDAVAFRGKRVRLRGAVRVEAGEGGARAYLWMRVDRPEDKTGFFDNMTDRPITSGEWQFYEIIGDVEEDAKTLNFGMLFSGRGKAYLDDVSVEDLGKTIVLAEPSRTLTKRGLANITAFTRVLGYVRHFHPSDEAVATDWDAFAVEGIRSIENAKNAAELARQLEIIFRPVAPTVKIYLTGKRAAADRELMPPDGEKSLKIISWRHVGYGHKNSQRYGYGSARVSADASAQTIPADALDSRQPFKADLGGGVSCVVPLALFADAKGTLPRSTNSLNAPVFYKYSAKDRTTRLAAVAHAWNVLQHFYPYFDVVRTDWRRVLGETLASAATDSDEKTFLRTLRQMVAGLHDGHGTVGHLSLVQTHTPPIVLGWIENRLVITSVVPEGADGLQPGDIVLKIDGKPAAAAIAETESLISSATPQWKRHSSVTTLRMGIKDSEMTLEVEDAAGKTRTVVLRRTIPRNDLRERQTEKIAEIKPGIFYVDLDRTSKEDFQNALPKLAAAKGIVFDIRGYPRVPFEFMTHLTDKPLLPPQFLRPIVTKPDRTGMTFPAASDFALKPEMPRLTAKMAFITDGRAISYAESVLGIVENYKLGVIVGEPTAGTNGNINPFDILGNYRIFWTGMKVLKYDGSQHHGVGIKPTVPVSRTIQGIREKRDEQLERAITIVSN